MAPTCLSEIEHRPWPIPRRPWIMRHTWDDLLFLHWAIPLESIRPLIPEPIAIDTFDGKAWIGLVPFRISYLRLRGLPRIPPSSFMELNVRIYVVRDGRPGVWFLSLDASSRLAVCFARAWYRLPYFPAHMSMTHDGDTIHFTSKRKRAMGGAFSCSYRPNGESIRPADWPLIRWLTAEIHHIPWTLQNAEITLDTNDMLSPLGLPNPEGPPLAHFSKRLEAIVWAPRRLTAEKYTLDNQCHPAPPLIHRRA